MGVSACSSNCIDVGLTALPGVSRAASYGLMTEADVVYDNSVAFAELLEKNGVKYVLGMEELVLRDPHRIVPHVRVP